MVFKVLPNHGYNQPFQPISHSTKQVSYAPATVIYSLYVKYAFIFFLQILMA